MPRPDSDTLALGVGSDRPSPGIDIKFDQLRYVPVERLIAIGDLAVVLQRWTDNSAVLTCSLGFSDRIHDLCKRLRDKFLKVHVKAPLIRREESTAEQSRR